MRIRRLTVSGLTCGAAVAAVIGLVPGAAMASGSRVIRPGEIATFAGGTGGPGQGTNVAVAGPCHVSYSGGSLYAGAGVVRKVSVSTGALSTPAGVGVTVPLGDGGLAASADVNACAAATDPAGNLLIADDGNQRIRVVAKTTGTFYGQAMTARHIYTVAGDGTAGFSGDGGAATAAELSGPDDVTVDHSGNLVIAATSNGRVRVVAESAGTFYGQAMTAGDIYTVAGGGTSNPGNGGPATAAEIIPVSVAVDKAGNLVIADGALNRIQVIAVRRGTFYGRFMIAGDIYSLAGDGKPGFHGDGGPAVRSKVEFPADATLDRSGNVIIADTTNERIRVIAESTGTFYGQAMTAGDIYTVAGTGHQGYNGDGEAATTAEMWFPNGATVDGSGNLVIADSGNDRLRVVAESTGTFYGQAMTAGDIYTVAGTGAPSFSGDGGPATTAELQGPDGVAVDGAGNTLIADTFNNRIRVVAGRTGTFYGQAMTAGDVYTVAGNGLGIYSGDGVPATQASIQDPHSVSADAAGNLIIADFENDRIRLVAEHTGTFYGQAMTAGDIYTVAGDGEPGASPDGTPATQAGLSFPDDAVTDPSGNLIIANTTARHLQVVAMSTGTFYGKAMTAGDIYTLAVDSHSGERTQYPQGVAADAAGNIVVADLPDHAIQVVAGSTGRFYGIAMTAGQVYDIFGGGRDAPDTALSPSAVAVDASGNVLIADATSNVVKALAENTGTFYGRAMTKGKMYTVAGDGAFGFTGDGGRGPLAELSGPQGVAAFAGGLLIADTGNNRIRVLGG